MGTRGRVRSPEKTPRFGITWKVDIVKGHTYGRSSQHQNLLAGCGFRIYAMDYSARMRFGFLVYLCTVVTSLHAEKPFDFASTPGKLPKQVRPTDYAIWIKPDIKKLTFAGRETVKLNVEQGTLQLVLNAADLTVSDAQLDNKTIPKTALKFDAKNELLTITA